MTKPRTTRSTSSEKAEPEVASAAKTAVIMQSNSNEELLLRLMTLDGSNLRAVFDHAVAQLRDERSIHERIHSERMTELAETVADEKDMIADLQSKIDRCHENIRRCHEEGVQTENENTRAQERFAAKRAFIENLEALFRSKLSGFEE